MASLPPTLPRAELESLIVHLTHEIRNQLNALSLEVTDLAEQTHTDLGRLQKLIQENALYLKTVRSLLAPDEPNPQPVRVSDLLQKVRARVERIGTVLFRWEENGLGAKTVRVDEAQVSAMLAALLEDAALLVRREKTLTSTPEAVPVRLRESGAGIVLEMELPIIPPQGVETWGHTPGVKVGDGLLTRYGIARTLAQNGGGCRWSYDTRERELIVQAEFGS